MSSPLFRTSTAGQSPSYAANAVLTVPATVQGGDLLFLETITSGATAPSAPAGWTQLGTSQLTDPANGGTGFSFMGSLFARIAAGAVGSASSDAGTTVTVSGSVAEYCLGQIVVYYNAGISSLASLVVSEVVRAPAATSGGSPTAASSTLTTSAANSTVVQLLAAVGCPFSGSPLFSSVTVPTTSETSWVSPSAVVDTPNPAISFSGATGVSDTVQATAGTSTAETFTLHTTASNTASAIIFTVSIVPESAPASPTPTAPANASYMDLSGTPTFSWTPNPSAGNGAQNAIAFRRKISGGSYVYWNTSTSAWQSGIVWNPYTTGSLTFPSGAWANGNIYNWSVATQEATENLQSAFATDWTLTGEAPPSVSVTGPTGTIQNMTPTVTATVTLPVGASVTAFEVKVFTAAQVAAGGFNPATSSGVYDSGVVSWSSTAIAQAVSGLSNNTTFYAYVQATETGGLTSAWASAPFTVSFDPPAQPTVTATASTSGLPEATIVVAGHDNLLTAADASFEGSLGSWTAGANTTVALSTVQALDGSESMALTATAAGAVSASTASYTL